MSYLRNSKQAMGFRILIKIPEEIRRILFICDLENVALGMN